MQLFFFEQLCIFTFQPNNCKCFSNSKTKMKTLKPIHFILCVSKNEQTSFSIFYSKAAFILKNVSQILRASTYHHLPKLLYTFFLEKIQTFKTITKKVSQIHFVYIKFCEKAIKCLIKHNFVHDCS